MYAKIENNKIVETVNSLKLKFPNVSFTKQMPETFEQWMAVKTPSDVPEDKVVSAEIELIDGLPFYKLVDIPLEDKQLHLKEYAKTYEYSPLTVNGFTETPLDDHRRFLKEAVDYLREINAPSDTTIMWQGKVEVTLEAALAWLLAAAPRRQKRFAAEGVDVTACRTLLEVEEAFDAAIAGLEA